MPWHAQLDLHYRRDQQRTVLQHRHTGPLRIFKSLYPEGDGICHNVIIHPPGGLVGGDVLEVNVRAGEQSHGLLATPGATRFYRSEGPATEQRVTLTLDKGARLEWLPLEAIAYPGCLALNHLTATLAENAEMIGWDVCALGLPNANQPFDRGSLTQRHYRVGWHGRRAEFPCGSQVGSVVVTAAGGDQPAPRRDLAQDLSILASVLAIIDLHSG